MADAGLPAPPTLQAPLAPQPPAQPVQPPIPSAKLVPAQPIQHMSQLNWSHFKPEFAGKPDEEAEAHLLRMNDWMDTHAFQEGFKVQYICLTLVGEARLWFESLTPIYVDWIRLQNQFRQQYSKIGNTREKLFHAWRSFHFDENTETLDSCVMHIKQIATPLGYWEPQVIEGFKNTLSTRLYWVLFPTEDLRQGIETVKRILTKEKIDRQLAVQSSSMPFMNMKDEFVSKKVTFDAQDGLEDKIDMHQ